MKLSIGAASEDVHRELASWRYPPPYDFEGAGAVQVWFTRVTVTRGLPAASAQHRTPGP